MLKPLCILLVDDDPQGLQGARRILEAEGHEVVTAGDGERALEIVRADESRFDAVITDVRMPRMTGLEFFKALSVLSCRVPVILMTAYGRLDEAVWAMKLGAVDFLSKPFKRKQLLDALEVAVSRSRHAPRSTPEPAGRVGAGQSTSPAMKRLQAQIEQVAPTAATCLIQGESGVGKERIAREIHALSPRASGPFIGINCAAIPENLLESELFGHEKGAFTGAQARKVGLFEAASGGTLLLDEIGDMPLSLQSKLLRVLQEGEYRRVGSVETVRADVRVLAATHQDLRSRVASGHFRQDLLYRLEVIVLDVPALRQRREDIAALASGFLRDACDRHAKPLISGFSADALDLLTGHAWPGNIRELQNAIERAVVLCGSALIEPADLPRTVIAGPEAKPAASPEISIPLGTSLKDVEDLMIRRTLEATQGDKELTAQILGVASRTIYRKLDRKEGPDA